MHAHSYERGKISTMGALSVSPKRKHVALYLRLHRKNLTGLEVKDFLSYLLTHLRGTIVLLWDRSSIHRRALVKEYLAKHPRIHVEEFPGYAPELNPAEYIWNHADRDLSNTAAEELEQLEGFLLESASRLSTSQPLLWACIYASDLPWR